MVFAEISAADPRHNLTKPDIFSGIFSRRFIKIDCLHFLQRRAGHPQPDKT